MFKDLADAEKVEVQKLSAILRVADALDHDHSRRVHTARVKADPGRVRLRLSPGEDTLIEQWALKKKSGLFEKVFGLELEVV